HTARRVASTEPFPATLKRVAHDDVPRPVAAVPATPQLHVSSSSSIYSTTLNRSSGNGTLGLNLVDDDSITDAVGNPLGGTGTGNVNVTGHVYTVDQTAPVPQSINRSTPAGPRTNAASVTFTVTVSESVSGVGHDD